MSEKRPFGDIELKMISDRILSIDDLEIFGNMEFGKYGAVDYRRFLDTIDGLKVENARLKDALGGIISAARKAVDLDTEPKEEK